MNENICTLQRFSVSCLMSAPSTMTVWSGMSVSECMSYSSDGMFIKVVGDESVLKVYFFVSKYGVVCFVVNDIENKVNNFDFV